WFNAAILVLRAEGPAGYGRFGRQMWARLASGSADDRLNLSHACVVAPDATGDPQAVVALAQWRRENFPTDPFGDSGLAAANYRAGQFREAAECLKSLPEQQRGMFDIFGWYIRAMAEQRLGHADEARQWFDRAEKWWGELPAKNPGIGADFLPVDWAFFHRLELQFLRKEAAELIRSDRNNGEPGK